MTKKMLLFLVCALCALGAMNLGTQEQAEACGGHEEAQKSQADKLAWRGDVEPALAEAKASNTPVVLFVSSEHCGSCTQMVDETLTDARVQEALKGFMAVHVDVTNSKAAPKLPKGVDTSKMPSVLFLDGKGQLVKEVKLTGFVKAEDFLTMIKKARASS